MNQKFLKETILSDKIINQIISSERWGIFHGSHIIEYFIDNDMEFEYANSSLRKKIIKQYISKKINLIFNDILEENPEILYRSVYLNKEPKNKGNFGIYWSSKQNTSPCIQHDCGDEYLLKIKFNNNVVNWVDTVLSRLDYIHGDREKEYQLYDKEVSLISFEKV